MESSKPNNSHEPIRSRTKRAFDGLWVGSLTVAATVFVIASVIAAMVGASNSQLVLFLSGLAGLIASYYAFKYLHRRMLSFDRVENGFASLVGIVGLGALIAFIVSPVIFASRPTYLRGMSSIKQSALALIIYISDHQDTFPSRRWVDAAEPFSGNSSVFRLGVAADPPDENSYFHAFNSHLAGMQLGKVDDPASAVMTFSSINPRRNAQDPLLTIRPNGLRSNWNLISRVDGSAKRVMAGHKLGRSNLNGQYVGDPLSKP